MGDATKTEKSNRPENTPFKQQRLRAWQPILTPKWVIGTFFVVGVIFIPVGVFLKLEAEKVYEQVELYDQTDGVASLDASCHVVDFNAGYKLLKNGNPYECKLEFSIDRDIVDEDLIVYYQLDNFYQNHRRYVKSRSDAQLRGQDVEDSDLEKSCDPTASFQYQINGTSSGHIYYPCGLIATSFFNDAFLIEEFTSGDTTFEYNHGMPTNNDAPRMEEDKIAWESDLEKKFKNPTSYNYDKYFYLWQNYDQMNCYNSVTYELEECTTWKELHETTPERDLDSVGCASCPPNTTTVWQGGVPPPESLSEDSAFGVRDEHFIVWMRTAGLPIFRKQYGRITAPPGGFKKGDVLKMNVVSNFEVGSFEGQKSLVIGTISPLGGKNNVLGVAYISVGSICLFLAVVFFIKERVAPRKLGDPKLLNW